MTCLNPDHSTIECTPLTQCLLCQSKTHTMDRCEYNLLNRQAGLSPRTTDGQMRIGSDGKTAIDQRADTDMMSDGEMTISGITTKGITLQNMTRKEAKDGTRTGKGAIPKSATQTTEGEISDGISIKRRT